MNEDLQAKLKEFWKNHAPVHWGIETEFLRVSTQDAIHAKITYQGRTVISAYYASGDDVNFIEEKAIIKVLERLLVSEE